MGYIVEMKMINMRTKEVYLLRVSHHHQHLPMTQNRGVGKLHGERQRKLQICSDGRLLHGKVGGRPASICVSYEIGWRAHIWFFFGWS
jgi:hypothetical protein